MFKHKRIRKRYDKNTFILHITVNNFIYKHILFYIYIYVSREIYKICVTLIKKNKKKKEIKCVYSFADAFEF